MLYSLANKTGNVAEKHLDSNSLLEFAYGCTKHHYNENVGGILGGSNIPFSGLVSLIQTSGTPFMFGYYLLTGPFVFKNKE